MSTFSSTRLRRPLRWRVGFIRTTNITRNVIQEVSHFATTCADLGEGNGEAIAVYTIHPFIHEGKDITDSNFHTNPILQGQVFTNCPWCLAIGRRLPRWFCWAKAQWGLQSSFSFTFLSLERFEILKYIYYSWHLKLTQQKQYKCAYWCLSTSWSQSKTFPKSCCLTYHANITCVNDFWRGLRLVQLGYWLIFITTTPIWIDLTTFCSGFPKVGISHQSQSQSWWAWCTAFQAFYSVEKYE